MSRFLFAAMVAVVLAGPNVMPAHGGRTPVWYADGYWAGGSWDEFGTKAE